VDRRRACARGSLQGSGPEEDDRTDGTGNGQPRPYSPPQYPISPAKRLGHVTTAIGHHHFPRVTQMAFNLSLAALESWNAGRADSHARTSGVLRARCASSGTAN